MSDTRTPDRRHVIEVSEIEQMLRGQCERLVLQLLPNAKRDGRHLCVGSITGEPGQSFKVEISGPRQGTYTDFSYPDAPDRQGKGDCLHLIRHVMFGGNMNDAIQWAKSWLGIDDLDPGRLATTRAQAREAAADIADKHAAEKTAKRRRAIAAFLGGKPIAGTPVEAYLRGRGIDVDRLGKWPGSLRFEAEMYNKELRVKIPAMLAAMYTPDGKHVATHRTYLNYCERRGWTKLDSPNAKMVLGSCGGSFIPLRKGASGKAMSDMPAGELVLITEGIEDALTAAMARPAARIVAGYSLPNIGSIVWPEAMGALVMLADRDEAGSAAVDALERVIARQQARGTAVRLVMPQAPFKDLNEWLQAGARESRRAGVR